MAQANTNGGWSDSIGLLPETPETPTPAEPVKPAGGWADSAAILQPYNKLKATAGPRGFTFAGRVVTNPDETIADTLKRTPAAELEAGSRVATGAADLAAMGGMAKLAAVVGANPAQAGKSALSAIKNIPAAWRDFWQNVGETVVDTAVPKYFRAGRGTPLEFREARLQMETDVANRMEQAASLGKALTKDLTVGERMRADQLLRGSITTAKTDPKLIAATAPVRQAIDEIQNDLIQLGRLSPETVERFQENFGPYLARLYTGKEFTKSPVFGIPQPVRAGTERLKVRGDRVQVDIPSLEEEMRRAARLLGPEAEFRREFRNRARELGTSKSKTETVSDKTETLGEKTTSQTTSSTQGDPGTFTQVPLSGVAKKLEDMVEGALVARGMTGPEAQAALGRVKAAAVKAHQGGPDVTITGGGTIKETVKETVERETRTTRETVRSVIEGLGVNKAQQAALHAYYDVISRLGAKAQKVTIGGKTFKVNPIMDVESATDRVEALDDLLRAGFKVEKREGNRVTMFRDIPEAERRALGEMRADPGYVAGKSIAQAGREVAITRFFKTVADNPEWTSAAAAAGYTQMPKDKKRLGDLAGKFVKDDIAGEINEAVRMKADWEKILAKTTQLWKIGKVTNPATMARNFYSSAILADFGGLSPWKPSGVKSYGTAVRAFLGKDPAAAALREEAKRVGLYNASYNQGELESLASGYIASKEENPILRMLEGVKRSIDKTGAGTAYGSIDTFYKTALFVHGRQELKMSAAEAGRYARKYGIDYGDISPAVRLMREIPLGSPFITFASKAIPLTIETAVKHPIRFWKWPAIAYGLNELSYRQFGAERDQVEKTAQMGHLNSPRYIALPGKAADGRYQFLDLGYVLPFGDLIEAYDKYAGGGGDANISFEPLGGPLQPFVELAFNKSLFTGKPIYNQTDSYPEAGAKVADYLGKSLLPNWAPPVPGTGFRGGYTTEAFRKAIKPDAQLIGEAPIPSADYFGRQRTLGATIASKLLGIDVKNVSVQDMQRVGVLELQKQLDELGRSMAAIARSSITPAQKQNELRVYEEKYKALASEIEKKLGMSESAPPLRKFSTPAGGSGWSDSMGIFK